MLTAGAGMGAHISGTLGTWAVLGTSLPGSAGRGCSQPHCWHGAARDQHSPAALRCHSHCVCWELPDPKQKQAENKHSQGQQKTRFPGPLKWALDSRLAPSNMEPGGVPFLASLPLIQGSPWIRQHGMPGGVSSRGSRATSPGSATRSQTRAG